MMQKNVRGLIRRLELTSQNRLGLFTSLKEQRLQLLLHSYFQVRLFVEEKTSNIVVTLKIFSLHE